MKPAIKVQNLRKHFGSVKAVDGATFDVPQGKVFGFLGPNGAGKTTTIQCLMDFIRPTSGTVTILGLDARNDSVELKKKIGYLPSGSHVYDNWTGQQHIDFLTAIRGASPDARLIDRLGLNTGVRVKKLSSGNRQKLEIVLAFLGSPELVIMDEPTRGLDPILQNELYKIIGEFKAGGGTVFMSSHNLPEVEKACDSIALINGGKIVVEETLQSLRAKSIHHISVIFDKTVDPQKYLLPGVSLIHHSGHSLTLRAKGEIEPIMRLICQQKFTELEVAHASLEEVFLEMTR